MSDAHDEIALRLTTDPVKFTTDLLAWLPDAPVDEVALTRHQLVDIAGYVKRYSASGFREALRAARLTEWEMAHRWPAKRKTGRRGDDRPSLLDASSKDDQEIWQRIYAVGRADRERLLSEADARQLTQAAVIRWTQPPVASKGVRQGDAREVLGDIEDGSVDLVLTDPPYGDKSRELYSWLASFASRVLRPGGSLCVVTGQSRLPDDLERLTVPGLRYWWTFAMLHGAAQRLPGIFVMVGWKPVLWFVKGTRGGRDMVGDVLRGEAYAKDEHRWAQGDGVRPLIERLCPEGGLVVDPFAGTGQWGDLARDLGREWIGADVGGEVVVA